MLLHPTIRNDAYKITPEQSFQTGKNSINQSLNQTGLTPRYDFSASHQLFQSKEQRRQLRRDIQASAQ